MCHGLCTLTHQAQQVHQGSVGSGQIGRGYHAMSIGSIAAHAGVSKARLHIEGTLISTDRRNEQVQELFPSVEELRTRILRTRIPLSPNAVHVWRLALSGITPLEKELRAVLSIDELSRSEKFHFPELRERFIAGRAVLRMILGDYCDSAPEDLCFGYSSYQKPRIESNGRLSQTVEFNLSHSGDVIQIAIAADGPLGIDVEDPAREFDVDRMVAECLSDQETRSQSGLSAAQWRKEFIRYWVHKEAFLKCVGTGFSVEPNEVHVAFNDSGRSVMRCSNPMANEVLYGRDLECREGLLAALATRRPDYILHSIVV